MGAVDVPVPQDFQDLSLNHSSMGALTTESSQDAGAWSKYRLTPEQVEQFWRDGYLSNIRVLSEDQCASILTDYQKFLVSSVYTQDYRPPTTGA